MGRIVALLPMKGHSERVKNKNLRNFDGQPLCSHIISSLNDSKEIDDIYIDTDSLEIEEYVSGLSSKIHIIIRPEALRGDMVSMNRIIEHDISTIDGDTFLQTHATNPLLSSATIDRACRKYLEVKNDSLFSVTRLQTRLYDKNGKAINHDPEKLIRTQDLDPLFEENSNLYLFSRKSFNEAGRRIGNDPFLFETDPIESMDIDTEEDFLIAEQIHKIRAKRR